MQEQTRECIQTSRSESVDGSAVKEILAGHQEAFDFLFHRYYDMIFNYIRKYLVDYDLSCDITQNVFIQLYLSLPTLRLDVSLRGWLYQVARRRCLDELSRRHAIPFSQMEVIEEDEDRSPFAILPDADALPEELIEQHEVRNTTLKAIGELPPRYRMVVFLRYTEQLRFSEISKRLNMPGATAKTYFHRARPLLRAALAPLRTQSEETAR